MTRTKSLAAVLTAAMLVLAGCSGAVSPGTATGTDAGANDDGSAMTDGSGTVTLYVSDQPGAMNDFEHVNVTINAVAYHQTTAENESAEAGAESEANATANATAEDEEMAAADEDDETAGDETESDADDDVENEAEGEDEMEAEDDSWHRYEVNETTVDLTELKGANATAIAQHHLNNGSYDKVFLYVEDVNATLKNGESANVKLPSGKLQLNEEFTVGNNESVDFVYDATVVKAGKSGKYILQPVVSESGTDVEIKEVARAESEGDISARFVGPVERGEAATVKVRQQGAAVAGATVEIGDREFQTAGDGTVTFDVPADSEEVEVEVEHGEAEAELKRKFGVEVEADAGVSVRVEGGAEDDTEDSADAEDEDDSDTETETETETDTKASGETTADSEVSADGETDDTDDTTDGSASASASANASASSDTDTTV